MNRRQFLTKSILGSTALVAASALSVTGHRFWPESGLTNPCLTGLPNALKNHPLMAKIWSDIDSSQVWDCHAHMIGTGDSNSGVWLNPSMNSWSHPILKIQKHFYMNGGCIADQNSDVSYVERMVALSTEMPSGYKTMLFAFDWLRDGQGVADKEHSIFYIPNDYAASVAKQYPQYFEWAASIHPYRTDALHDLEEAHNNGARAIKWLPSSMGINPASTKCNKFYQKLHDLNMPIISHTGRERAVQGGHQAYCNPLRMRRALDAGVRVVLAHCASDGDDDDLDNGNKSVKSFDLFSRLMDTPAYKDLAFGDISALALFNNAWAIKPLLARTDWHHRLINGSDYPLPGILPLISIKELAHMGLLQKEQVPFLQDLRNYNPLMFDFATKRLINFEGNVFTKSIFETRNFFEKTRA